MLNQPDIEFLSTTLPFWPQLTAPQKELLTTSANIAHFHKGQSIHCGEDKCIGVLIIRSGSLRIYITSDEGREVTLYRLGDGDICILSASCVLDAIAFDVSIDAETDCETVQIQSPVFARLTAANIYAELFTYKLTTERFSDVMWTMQQILFISFDKRLAAFLLDESSKSGSLNIPYTHEQIARYLGSAREVVSRMLKYFSREGYVTLSRGAICIQDKAALRALL